MKLVLAIIQPTKLRAVQDALANIGVERMTVCDAQGYGRQRGSQQVSSEEVKATLLRKIALEIVVNDDFLDRTVGTITTVARSGPDGKIGDGKVFVIPCDDACMSDGKIRGPEAV